MIEIQSVSGKKFIINLEKICFIELNYDEVDLYFDNQQKIVINIKEYQNNIQPKIKNILKG